MRQGQSAPGPTCVWILDGILKPWTVPKLAVWTGQWIEIHSMPPIWVGQCFVDTMGNSENQLEAESAGAESCHKPHSLKVSLRPEAQTKENLAKAGLEAKL